MMERQQDIGARIAAEAELWIDTPFRWQGRKRGVGCDCKGLIAGVAESCGRPEAESLEALSGDYSNIVDERRLFAGLSRLFDRVSERQAGDVLLLWIDGKAQHLAIAAPSSRRPDRVIEAMIGRLARVRPGMAPSHRVVAIFRWRRDTDCARARGSD
ncbi:hypothetical protein [Novosphingobium mangrovi (ex Huang et al. 2023)]|uniref:Peptidase P60 n=1 Tax=Novosphingobium mangrovi (ex Huang et al. 2023) TaxID=2976432 RepID=A0ABT2I153_9SPHN|nr:hypothetical protein [Novosphingobium mangrovi (ex Huang et al. 2023)]MCT2398534.1 hypothetical protein [Novosphingobium mangrovi (ex Huang et al. 2023)]